MILDERDIALSIEHRTRQLWAEKHLEMPPSPREEAWTQWYNLLHDQVDAGSRALRPSAPDLTPKSPEEPFTAEYQARLVAALRDPGMAIGAHYVYGNACVRVPLTVRTDADQLQVYLLGLYPADQHASGRTIGEFMAVKTVV